MKILSEAQMLTSRDNVFSNMLLIVAACYNFPFGLEITFVSNEGDWSPFHLLNRC